MNENEIRIRDATLDDAQALAVLINFAGEGLPLYLWEGMAEPGQDPWQVGRQRASREEGSFSYHNTVVAEIDGTIAGCLIGYPLAAEPKPVDLEGMPAMFVPLQELENLAPDTWYINVVAAFPEFRGRGVGTRLLEAAEQYAIGVGKQGLSLIVADGNVGAIRLYEREGYREIAKRAMVKEQWKSESRNWVLLTRDVPR